MSLSFDEIINPPMRKCPKCNETKTIYEFKLKGTSNPFLYCRSCIAEEKKKQKQLIITRKKEKERDRARIRNLMNMVNGTNVYTTFLNADLTGICAMCGEILLFGEFHHIFGEGVGFTVMLCDECHLSAGRRSKNHCISIGRRIEWGALCYY